MKQYITQKGYHYQIKNGKKVRIPQEDKIVEAPNLLIIVDVQNDFVNHGLFKKNSKVQNVKKMVDNICKKIIKCAKDKKNKWHFVLSRDYHPTGHCSHELFGKHCLYGDKGSEINSKIVSTLKSLCSEGTINENDIEIVYKGFNMNTDSFGVIPYHHSYYKKRMSDVFGVDGCSPKLKKDNIKYTGGFSLRKNSDIHFMGNIKNKDIYPYFTKKRFPKLINIEACGLVADYCVMDTCINATFMFPKSKVVFLEKLTVWLLNKPSDTKKVLKEYGVVISSM